MSDIFYPRAAFLLFKFNSAAFIYLLDYVVDIITTKVLSSPKKAYLRYAGNVFNSNLGASLMEGLGGGTNALFKGSQQSPVFTISDTSKNYTISCTSASSYKSLPTNTRSRGSLVAIYLAYASRSITVMDDNSSYTAGIFEALYQSKTSTLS